MIAVVRAAGRAAAAVPVAQLARLGPSAALAATLGLAVLVLAVICWVLASDARCASAWP